MKKIKHFLIFLLLGVLLFSLFFPACGTSNENSQGKICTLAEAYDAGKITREHLLNIAYYANSAKYNSEIDENFTPIPKAELSDKTSLKIRQAVADMLRDLKGYENETADDYSIINYYGCYNGCYVFFYEWLNGLFPEVIRQYQEEIDNVFFYFNYPIKTTIYVWTDE